MRIGILGLGRIGAFHAETLSGLDAVDSLVVADPFADAAKAAAERFGAEVADSPRPCWPLAWTASSSRRPRTPTRP